jgi:hypothetical protein
MVDVLELISQHELDLHHHVGKDKVSVWHGPSLTRVTANYSDHGGALGALSFAVQRCVENKLAEGA